MERLTLLGVQIDALNITQLNSCIANAIDENKHIIIANHNLHSIYLYQRDAKMRAFFKKASIVHIDGMPLVFWGRILGNPMKRSHRVTYVDWVSPLMTQAAQNGWRIFYLGGKPSIAEEAANILRSQQPDLQINTFHGYFQKEDHPQIFKQIRQFKPHIVMVGMGMPRQEHWIYDHLDDIEANVILTPGACFDYVVGEIATAPRWMGRWGLEWLYRLLAEPTRLWKRYLVEPWSLIPLMAKDIRRKISEPLD